MGSFGFPFFTSAGIRRASVRMQMLSVGTTPRDFIEALVESLRLSNIAGTTNLTIRNGFRKSSTTSQTLMD